MGAHWVKQGMRGLLAWALVLALLPIGEEATPAGAGAVVQVPEKPPLVALTFDDGPRADTTVRLLEGLALREVPATFFLVGECIPNNEDLIRTMAAAGHQIGVHTYDHVRITQLTRTEYDLQVGRTRELLTRILGEQDLWLRPPYGIVDPTVTQWADGPLVLWSVDPEDWKDRNVERITSAVVEEAEDGDIILLHDIYDSSVDAALDIVDALQERGFCFVTVEQLMELRQVEPERGVLYTALPEGAKS